MKLIIQLWGDNQTFEITWGPQWPQWWFIHWCSGFCEDCDRLTAEDRNRSRGWVVVIEGRVLCNLVFWLFMLIENSAKVMHYSKELQRHDGELSSCRDSASCKDVTLLAPPLFFMLTDPMPESATELLPESVVWGVWAAFESLCSTWVILAVVSAESGSFALVSSNVGTVVLGAEISTSFSSGMSNSLNMGLWTCLVLPNGAEPVSCPKESRTFAEMVLCSCPLLEKELLKYPE